MGKCYCDYCDVFLTNDSVAVRKQHNDGNRHKYNVCEYYRQYIGTQLQRRIDAIVLQFEADLAAGLLRPTYALPQPAAAAALDAHAAAHPAPPHTRPVIHPGPGPAPPVPPAQHPPPQPPTSHSPPPPPSPSPPPPPHHTVASLPLASQPPKPQQQQQQSSPPPPPPPPPPLPPPPPPATTTATTPSTSSARQ